ncbi:MAG: YlmH/Sll1252 family protein [Lachnospiraceae bacterium]|nr:YlmH/Sll1252 family protein [Lachnospiraceae bacterium]
MNTDQSRLLSHFEDMANRAYERGIPCASDFLNLNEQSLFHGAGKQFGFCQIREDGGHPSAERKRIFFFPPDYPAEAAEDYIQEQITCLSITPVQAKFADSLTHRDFLGAVLNLGIDRSRVGDIFVQEQTSAWCLLDSRIGAFVCDNLTRVKHTTVHTELSGSLPEDFVIPTESRKGSVASLRIDALIALAFKLSRTQASECIREERVFLQGKLVRSGAETVKPGQIVSLRGQGRFRFEKILGETKKERNFVEISIFR